MSRDPELTDIGPIEAGSDSGNGCEVPQGGWWEQFSPSPGHGLVTGAFIQTGNLMMTVTIEGLGQDVPAVSEWGLVAMTLLVLAAGGAIISKRRWVAA
jgi:hypothetical protein